MESMSTSKEHHQTVTINVELPILEQFLIQGERAMKYITLAILTLQNATLNVLMRLVRTQRVLFLSSTAVVLSEMIKLAFSLFMVWGSDGEFKLMLFLSSLKKEVFNQPKEIFKIAIPSFVYLIQNNLIYVGATHLDAATCQVTYQLKILTTALMSVVMLNKRLNPYQWISLLILFIGIALVQFAQFDTPANSQDNSGQSPLKGFLAILAACFMSGFAGVYFEKILKGGQTSVWMRNVQLCASSIPLGFATIYFMDYSEVHEKGFFHGYNFIVWIVVWLQAFGGLIVALVVKFADNILKGFATSLAIVLSCMVSVYYFEFQLTAKFVIGASLVIASIFLYGKPHKTEEKISS